LVDYAPGDFSSINDELNTALVKMDNLRIGAVLVTEGGKLTGIFTERDLVGVYAKKVDNPRKLPVSQFMTSNPITAQITDDYNSVYMLMKVNNIRHIPILEGEKLVGIVSIRDLIHYYQNRLESEFAEARERIDAMKKLVRLSAEDVLESLFAEINKYKELSLTDHLTGLYNKRYFLMRLREEVSRAIRHKQNLALIFCDIDHFKAINDNYGHHHGDLILRQIGDILAGGMGDLKVVSRLRKSDIIARYGGEEFVAILPATTVENAQIAAEKMRSVMEAESFTIEGEVVRITMSFGVAAMNDKISDAEDLIQNADNAMYKAKENGRNQVAVFGE
ncbi:MAG: GGDEF domain-containing protein, partial [Spirochaetales bacterium]|nr:GGDEF domain-containing protein [Spirochaetales bacterium]